MPGYIAEFGGKYCVWSTATEAPTSRLMTEGELFTYLCKENPETDWELFQARMARVRQTGCSAAYGPTKSDLLACNRAGPNESHVATEAGMVALYSRTKE